MPTLIISIPLINLKELAGKSKKIILFLTKKCY